MLGSGTGAFARSFPKSVSPHMPHQRILLTGDWRFRVDPQNVGLAAQWFDLNHDDSDWGRLGVPGNWEHSGIDDYEGAGWYRHGFSLDDTQAVGLRTLGVVGVDQSVRVWLNGHELNPAAFTPRAFAYRVDELLQSGENTLALRVCGTGGPGGMIGLVQLFAGDDPDAGLRGPHAMVPARHSPDWVRDAVIYEVYLRSVSPAGTFRGLQNRLDALQALGVTVLWLMPIHPIGQKHRKGTLGCPYSARDYLDVSPEHGTIDDLRALIAAAHERGMTLIIDMVLNHSAWDCPLVEQHPDWYTHDDAGRIVPPNPDWSDVAELNYEKPQLRRYMTDALLFWLRDVGVDGFRCDVSGLLPTDFWETARDELDAGGPLLMLAEDDQPVVHRQAFDLTYDWRLYDHLARLRTGRLTARDIINILRDEELLFPQGSLRMRFSTNHDKNAWDASAIERYGPDAARIAALLTFLLPGVPMIYNGQEAANTLRLSLFERIAIDWTTPDHGLREFYTQLCRLYAARPSLRRGRIEFIEPGEDNRVLGLVRTCEFDAHEGQPGEAHLTDSVEHTIALLNLAPEPATAQSVSFARAAQPRPLLISTALAMNPSPPRILPPHSYWIAAT